MKKVGRAAALFALMLAGCDVASPTAPEVEAPQYAGMGVRCKVRPAFATMTCGSTSPAALPGARALIVGGQNTYVRLSNGLITWTEGTGVFQVDDVVIENLMAQVMGTTDESDDTGVRVFFASGPVATVGTGAVTVANPDATGTFTAEGQPYFEYAGLIPTFGTSEPKTWIFNVGPDVDEFEFGVYVHTDLPHESSILRFEVEVEDPDAIYLWLWAASAENAFAVGLDLNTGGASIGRRTSLGWVFENQVEGTDIPPLWDIWGSSATDVFAVGDGGAILHWDGALWSVQPNGLPPEDCNCLTAVTGSGPGDVWAGGDGGLLLHYDGATWTEQTALPATDIWAMWAAGPNDVYAVITEDDVDGFDALYRYQGGVWSEVTLPLPGGTFLYSVWGRSGSDVYLSHDDGVLHFDGATWSDVAGLGGCAYGGVWGTSPTNLFVMEQCGVRHSDGSTWAYMDPGGSPIDMYGGAANSLFVTVDGLILRGTR